MLLIFYQFKGSLVKTPWHVTRTDCLKINYPVIFQLSLIISGHLVSIKWIIDYKPYGNMARGSYIKVY